MLGVKPYLIVLLPLAAALMLYYLLYLHKRLWMLDVESFERFLERERRYKERADPAGLEAYLEGWRARRRRLVFWSRLVFGAAALALFVGFVYLRTEAGQ